MARQKGLSAANPAYRYLAPVMLRAEQHGIGDQLRIIGRRRDERFAIQMISSMHADWRRHS